MFTNILQDRHLAEGSLVYAIQEASIKNTFEYRERLLIICYRHQLTDPATAGSSDPLLTRSLHSTVILRSSQPYVPRLPDKA